MTTVTQHIVKSKGRVREVLFVDKNDVMPMEMVRQDGGLCGTELIVWADRGYKAVIENVEGVVFVYGNSTRYDITIDPRYDVDIVKKEIEAAILCNKPDLTKENGNGDDYPF